jgi:hypothetical protein
VEVLGKKPFLRHLTSYLRHHQFHHFVVAAAVAVVE